MRKCSAPFCPDRVDDKKLMCRAHWATLSKEIQDEVYRSWRAYSRVSAFHARFDAYRADYYAAAKKAIRAVPRSGAA